MPEKIKVQLIEDEMKQSYIDYAMSVITARALPDVRDGLKPVHRRILYAMHKLKLTNDKQYRKCAYVVGRVLGSYHPHGDMSVYDALVRLAQDFSMRYPLIQGHGNFGCFTKDTKVILTDGRKLSFEDLIKEYNEDKKNYTYTINKLGNVSIAEIKNPRLTFKNKEIMKIVLDNEEEIKCTLNHKFMLRDGEYKEAQNLKAGDSLMPLESERLNHKVKEVIFIKEKQDVYDLTIDGTHNFALASGVFVHNSQDGYPPAAQRYTECRLAKISNEMLKNIDENTVDFIPNYDGSTKEPVVLPAVLPNLLINGSTGIAVGMATNIPPHNIKEVVDATVAMIDNNEITISELMKVLPGPDFPTGGIIAGSYGIKNAYETGRGKVTVLAKTQFEEVEGKNKIIITEIPYMVNKSLLIEEMADLVKDKKIDGISDLRDESDRKGMRIVVELKQGYEPEVVLNQLQKYSSLKTTFGIIIIALVDGKPKILNLMELLKYFIEHRKNVTVKRLNFELEKSRERAHVLLGIKVALAHIDAVVQTIKKSESPEIAKRSLVEKFKLSEKQSEAILEMRLQRLTSLETNKIIEEHDRLVNRIHELREILASEPRIYSIIREELLSLKNEYGDERKTVLSEELIILGEGDLVAEEDIVVTMTHSGYVKRLPADTYKTQRRGGKGIIGTEAKEGDFVENLFITSTHDYLLFFTNKGKLYWLKAYDIPEGARYSSGKAIVNLLNLENDEKVNTLIPVKDFTKGYLVMLTKKGLIKKCKLELFARPRSNGVRCVTLKEKDELINVIHTDGSQKLILGTRKGMAVKFDEGNVRAMGRSASGVRAIRLKAGDVVVGIDLADEKLSLLTLTENGYGKRTEIQDYRLIRRGGSGVINIKTTSRNGNVIGIKTVTEDDELFLITQKGIILRTETKNISKIGRNTQGVRIIRVGNGDKLNSIAKALKENEQ